MTTNTTEEEESLFTVDGSTNGAATRKSVWKCLENLKIELPHDLAIPPLDIYPNGSVSHHRDTVMFIADLFIVTRK